MNATVTCKKCGKPLGVFDGNTCADCSKIEQIRAEIKKEYEDNVGWCGDNDLYTLGLKKALDIIDKYR